jgi:hypothetical protein
VERLHELRRVCGNTNLRAVERGILGIGFPAHQLRSVVTALFTAFNEEITGLQFHRNAGQHAQLKGFAVDGHHGHVPPMPVGDGFPPADRHPGDVQALRGVRLPLAHRQPRYPGIPMAQDKGQRLLEGRVRTGGDGVQKGHDIQQELPMMTHAGEQKRQVVVPSIRQIRFAPLTDGVDILPQQCANRPELLFCGLTALPAAHNLTEQGDQGIGLLLVLIPVVIEQQFPVTQ